MRSNWLYLATRSRAGQRAGLDLRRGGGHREVGDGGVLGLAGAVRDDRGVAAPLGHGDRLQGLGQRADLVDLDQDRVGDALVDAFAGRSSVLVTNRSSPTSWTLLAEALGQELPAVPVVLGQAVLDGDDRVLRDPAGEEVDELLARSARLPSPARWYMPFSIELGGGHVQAEQMSSPALKPALPIASRIASTASSLSAGPARSRPRRPPPCSGRGPSAPTSGHGRSRRRSAALRRSCSTPTGRIMNSWKSTLLSACAPPLMMFIIGTGSTGVAAIGEVLVQRHLPRAAHRVRDGQRDAEQRIGAEAALVLGAVEFDQALVEARPGRWHPCRSSASRDLAVDVGRPPCARPCRR